MGYPIQLVGLEGKRVLVAGGGSVAAGRMEGLVASGASVHLVALCVSEEMKVWLSRVDCFERRAIRDEDVIGAALVIAATDDRSVNRRLATMARERGILANAVDDPEASTFFAPAVLRRGPVTLTVSTDGGSPLLSARLRRLLEAALPRGLTTIGELFSSLRSRGWKGLSRTSKLLHALADPRIGRLVDRGETEEAARRVEAIAEESEERFDPGTVSIVGAGPGSRSLLTLRALDRIQRADVILHDALVEPEVLALALPETRIVHVGWRADPVRGGGGGVADDRQALIHALLIHEARAGKRVVRLHAGDSFVFGRGSEEGDALDAAGVPWEIVPGVSAVLAAPAAAKIPLTHRGEARGISVRTGHTVRGPSSTDVPKDEQTVVILMGLGNARRIMQGLIDEGFSPDTPAVAVGSASRAGERVVRATIVTLADRIEREKLDSPATLIVGKVVRRAVEDGLARSAAPSKEAAA